VGSANSIQATVVGGADAARRRLLQGGDLDYIAVVTQITFNTSWGPGPSIRGVVGTTQTMEMAVLFSDGTVFEQAVGGVQAEWVTVDQYLVFASDTSAVVSVSGDAVATLLANHYTTVTLSAESFCASYNNVPTAVQSEELNANLDPAVGDVDLGFLPNGYAGSGAGGTGAGDGGDDGDGFPWDGALFAPINNGAMLDMQMRVNTGTGYLLEFQIVVNAPSFKAVAGSCMVGADWKGQVWDCNEYLSPGALQVVGVDQQLRSGPSTGLVVASWTLEATATDTLVSFGLFLAKLTFRHLDGSPDTATVLTNALAGGVPPPPPHTPCAF
jgi:hypothetical protein